VVGLELGGDDYLAKPSGMRELRVPVRGLLRRAGGQVVVFNVQPKRKWDPSNNVLDKEPKRHADIYIFALLTHADQDTIDPLNLDQWEFYVVATSLLDNRKRSQHSITLKSLKQLIQPVSYTALYETIEVTGKTILAPV